MWNAAAKHITELNGITTKNCFIFLKDWFAFHCNVKVKSVNQNSSLAKQISQPVFFLLLKLLPFYINFLMILIFCIFYFPTILKGKQHGWKLGALTPVIRCTQISQKPLFITDTKCIVCNSVFGCWWSESSPLLLLLPSLLNFKIKIYHHPCTHQQIQHLCPLRRESYFIFLMTQSLLYCEERRQRF